MKKHEKLLKEIKDEVLLNSVSGAGGFGYNPGPTYIWAGIMDAIKSCSWPGGFYGSSLPSGAGICTRR